MQFWKPEKEFAVGVDLHWDNMVLCLLRKDGEKLVHRRLRNDPRTLRRVLTPYLESVTVAVESTGTWYWLCDVCAEMGVEFVLGHALYMKWIHGAKAKNDFIDSEKIARMLLGGNLPFAYAHPKEMRSVRDLLRRRSRFVAMRTGMMAHIKVVNAQANMPALGKATATREARSAIAGRFEDATAAMSVEADAVTIDYYESIIAQIEKHILARTKEHCPKNLALLMSTPGIGKILALTILLEVHDIGRFPTRQDFCSYARLIHDPHRSNGKATGSAGRKIGNPYLKWAFSEVAALSPRCDARINGLLQRLQKKRGQGRGLSVLAHKFGRAIYQMLENGTTFDIERFLNG